MTQVQFTELSEKSISSLCKDFLLRVRNKTNFNKPLPLLSSFENEQKGGNPTFFVCLARNLRKEKVTKKTVSHTQRKKNPMEKLKTNKNWSKPFFLIRLKKKTFVFHAFWVLATQKKQPESKKETRTLFLSKKKLEINPFFENSKKFIFLDSFSLGSDAKQEVTSSLFPSSSFPQVERKDTKEGQAMHKNPFLPKEQREEGKTKDKEASGREEQKNKERELFKKQEPTLTHQVKLDKKSQFFSIIPTILKRLFKTPYLASHSLPSLSTKGQETNKFPFNYVDKSSFDLKNNFKKNSFHRTHFNMPYRKPFFSYWLLPFLGLVTLIPDTKKQAFYAELKLNSLLVTSSSSFAVSSPSYTQALPSLPSEEGVQRSTFPLLSFPSSVSPRATKQEGSTLVSLQKREEGTRSGRKELAKEMEKKKTEIFRANIENQSFPKKIAPFFNESSPFLPFAPVPLTATQKVEGKAFLTNTKKKVSFPTSSYSKSFFSLENLLKKTKSISYLNTSNSSFARKDLELHGFKNEAISSINSYKKNGRKMNKLKRLTFSVRSLAPSSVSFPFLLPSGTSSFLLRKSVPVLPLSKGGTGEENVYATGKGEQEQRSSKEDKNGLSPLIAIEGKLLVSTSIPQRRGEKDYLQDLLHQCLVSRDLISLSPEIKGFSSPVLVPLGGITVEEGKKEIPFLKLYLDQTRLFSELKAKENDDRSSLLFSKEGPTLEKSPSPIFLQTSSSFAKQTEVAPFSERQEQKRIVKEKKKLTENSYASWLLNEFSFVYSTPLKESSLPSLFPQRGGQRDLQSREKERATLNFDENSKIEVMRYPILVSGFQKSSLKNKVRFVKRDYKGERPTNSLISPLFAYPLLNLKNSSPFLLQSTGQGMQPPSSLFSKNQKQTSQKALPFIFNKSTLKNQLKGFELRPLTFNQKELNLNSIKKVKGSLFTHNELIRAGQRKTIKPFDTFHRKQSRKMGVRMDKLFRGSLSLTSSMSPQSASRLVRQKTLLKDTRGKDSLLKIGQEKETFFRKGKKGLAFPSGLAEQRRGEQEKGNGKNRRTTSNLLLKNRFNFKKDVQNQGPFSPSYSITAWIKDLNETARVNKQSRVTMTLQKRQRAQPRPSWSRNVLAKKFLQQRHTDRISSKPTFLVSSFPKSSDSRFLTSEVRKRTGVLQSSNLEEKTFSGKRDLHASYLQNRNNTFSSFLSKGEDAFPSSGSSKEETGERNKKEVSLPSSFTPVEKEYYSVSQEVFAQFEKDLWKSSWLRTNLKAYLAKVKTSFLLLKETSAQRFLNDQAFLLQKQNEELLPRSSKETPLSLLLPLLSSPKGGEEGGSKGQDKPSNLTSLAMNTTKTENWGHVAEYNQITFNRIQQIIKKSNHASLINSAPSPFLSREENGSVRSFFGVKLPQEEGIEQKHMAHRPFNNARFKLKQAINRDYSFFYFMNKIIQTPQTQKIKFQKQLREHPFFTVQRFGNLSEKKVYWALNKTNMWRFNKLNKKEYLWANQKQLKLRGDNKTKKLIHESVTLINLPFQDKYTPFRAYRLAEGLSVPFASPSLGFQSIQRKGEQERDGRNSPATPTETVNIEKLEKSFNNFLRRQKLKEIKIGDMGLFESNSYKLNFVSQLNSINPLIRKNFEKMHPNLRLERSYKQALINSSNFVRKDYKLFLRNLKNSLKVFPAPSSLSFPQRGRGEGLPGERGQRARFSALVKKSEFEGSAFSKNKNYVRQNFFTAPFLKAKNNPFFTFTQITSKKKMQEMNSLNPYSRGVRGLAYAKKPFFAIGNTYNSPKEPISISSLRGQRNVEKNNFFLDFGTQAFLLSTIVFHLASLVSLINISQVRGVLQTFVLFSFKVSSFLQILVPVLPYFAPPSISAPSPFSSLPLAPLSSLPAPYSEVLRRREQKKGRKSNKKQEHPLEETNYLLITLPPKPKIKDATQNDSSKTQQKQRGNDKGVGQKTVTELPFFKTKVRLAKGLPSYSLPALSPLLLLKSSKKRRTRLTSSPVPSFFSPLLFPVPLPFSRRLTEQGSGEKGKETRNLLPKLSFLINRTKFLISQDKTLRPFILQPIKREKKAIRAHLIGTKLKRVLLNSYLIGFKPIGTVFFSGLTKLLELKNAGIKTFLFYFAKPYIEDTYFLNKYLLIEFASGLTTNLPEKIDKSVWKIFTKLAKVASLRTMPILGTLLEKRILTSFEILLERLGQPNTDLIIRQEKGQIFLATWGETLIKLAKQNQINMTSFSQKKEDQTLLLSKLIQSQTKKGLFSLFLEKTQNSFGRSREQEKQSREFSLWKKRVKVGKGQEEKELRLGTKILVDSLKNKNWRRWSAKQFIIFKDRDTNLIIQAPPAPKSFHSLSLSPTGGRGQSEKGGYDREQATKNTPSKLSPFRLMNGIAPLGTIICQIYSGNFVKKPAKNLLVVGLNQGLERNTNSDQKSLLIQSLAGETEMTLITDNANRYNFSSGIKLLRTVFNAVALQAPCIFLIEDIHVIGLRRPLANSDDEKADDISIEGIQLQNEDSAEEKHLILARAHRYSLMQYGKSYRGEFSTFIQANNFAPDLFLGVDSPSFGRSGQSGFTPLSPFSLESSASSLGHDESTSGEEEAHILIHSSNFNAELTRRNFLKSNNTVAELPWMKENTPPSVGPEKQLSIKAFSSSPSFLSPTSNLKLGKYKSASKNLNNQSSIREKIALLASLAVSSLSTKLNMITDLLIILDSVRSNRGFVVFATTHAPSLLDPGLRRPGRLDETIALPFIPKLESRWEIVKSNVASLNTIPASSFFDTRTCFLPLFPTVLKTKSILFAKPIIFAASSALRRVQGKEQAYKAFSIFLQKEKGKEKAGIKKKQNHKREAKGDLGFPSGLTIDLLDYGLFNVSFSISNLQTLKIQEKLTSLKKKQKSFPLGLPSRERMKLNRINETLIGDNILKPSSVDKKNYSLANSLANSITSSVCAATPPLFLASPRRLAEQRRGEKGSYLKINSLPNVALRAAYEKIGTFLVNNKFAQNRKGDVQTNVSLFNALHTKSNNQTGFSEQLLDKTAPYLHLYSKQDKIKQYLLGLFAPKVAETFAFSLRKTKKDYKTKPLPYLGAPSLEGSSLSVLSHKAGIPNFGLWSLRGIEKTWRAASSLIFKLIEKRLIYKKTIILPKLLQFFNAATQTGSLQDVPSHLAASLLLPAKRYESYKRAFLAMQRSPNSNAAPRYPSPMAALRKKQEKGGEEGLASYGEQEKGKESKPFASPEILLPSEKKKGQETGRNSTFDQAFSNREGAFPPLSIVGGEQEGEEFFDKPTAFNGYYRNRILDRHRGYLNNQWWNGQLGEHNLESISLSDIELRTSVASFSGSEVHKKPLLRNKRRKTLPSEIAASLLQEDEQKRNKTFIAKKLPKQSSDLLDPDGKKIFRTYGALEQKQPSLSLLPVLLPSTLSKDVENKRITPLEKGEEKTIEKKDYFFDYPDFDQHYNPGNRRWVLHFGYWSYWYNFKATHKAEIYSYMVTESFLTTFNFLNSNREIMDYFVTKILKSGLIKEISLIEGLKRF